MPDIQILSPHLADLIAAGEVVVVDGVDRLRDGLRVRVTAGMETPRVTVPATESGE